MPLYLLLGQTSFAVYLSVVIGAFLLGIALCHRTAARLGTHDAPAIVWDEIVGYLITMTAAPSGGLWVILGFILFRLFDILKPWPIRLADRKVPGGLGIMLDDALAGVFSLVIMQILSNLLS